MALVELTAICLGLTLFGLGLLHVYWALGGTRHRQFATPRVGGRPTARPTCLAFLAVAAGLWLAALVALSPVVPVGIVDVHGSATAWAWVFSSLFAFRALGDFRLIGFFCRRVDAGHRKLEREVTVPLCILMSLAFARLALLPHPH